jgi:hypothetical protein
MIKIKLNSKIEEIKKSSPQYKEASTSSISGKKPLDRLFDGKPRIAKVIDINIPKFLTGIEVVNEFSKTVINSSEKSLKSYANVYEDMQNKYSPNDPLYAEYQEIVDVENERRRRLRKEPFVKLVNDIMSQKGTEGVKGLMTGLLGTYASLGLTIDLDKKLISSAKEVPNPKSPTGKSPAPRNNFLKFLEMHKEAVLELEQIAAKDGITGYQFTEKIEAESLKKYFKNANIPKEVTYFKALPPKCQDFAKEVARLTVSRYDDLNTYLMGSMFSSYGTSYQRSEQIEAVSELLNRFAYKLVTSKKSDKMTMVFTRVPIEIVRMSDFSNLHSCHSVGREYSSCATQESISEAGSVIYLFKTIFDDKKISYIESTTKEILKDDERKIRGLVPESRIRLRTYIFNKNLYISVPQSNIYGESYISFYKEANEFAKQKQASEISKIVSLLQDPNNTGYFKLMGGGYSEGNLEAELADFLGVEEGIINIATREYPESFDLINIPEDTDVEEEFSLVTKEILQKYSNIIDVTVLGEVFPIGGAGYASGESEPDESPDYTQKVTIKLYASLAVALLTMLSKNIADTTGVSKGDVDDYLNKYFKDVKESKEFMALMSKIKAKNKSFNIDNDTLSISKVYNERKPEEARIKINKQVESFSLALQDIGNPNNYPELVKDIQSAYGNSEDEEELKEAKSVFKRLMGR